MQDFFKRDLVTSTDSYKISHPSQYPAGSEYAMLYIESRGGEFDKTVIAGTHFISRVIDNGITSQEVERANALFRAHFGYDLFYVDAWRRIVTEFSGKLPINIYAVPEGTVVPTHNVVLTAINSHKDYCWLAGHLEMFLLRGVWYPSTVSTISFHAKLAFMRAMEKSSSLTGDAADFVLKTRLHDFGSRGVSSEESARIGDLAHLIHMVGTDTVEGMIMAQELYNTRWDFAAGISIPAREHTTTISYGEDGKLLPVQEDQAYLNSIRKWGDKVYACVMDSINFEESVDRITTGELKDEIISRGGTFVLRPDSGNMFDNIKYALDAVANNVGYTTNDKGYKVLHPSFRLIQGDGLDSVDVIERVVNFIVGLGYSIENVAFGMGGGLLQRCDRDTQKWAMKCCAIVRDGQWYSVRKNPAGCAWKASKAGFIDLIKVDGQFKTIDRHSDHQYNDVPSELVPIVLEGRSVLNVYSESGFVQLRKFADEQAMMYANIN